MQNKFNQIKKENNAKTQSSMFLKRRVLRYLKKEAFKNITLGKLTQKFNQDSDKRLTLRVFKGLKKNQVEKLRLKNMKKWGAERIPEGLEVKKSREFNLKMTHFAVDFLKSGVSDSQTSLQAKD